MDPHSRLVQYNHRPPKAGPPIQITRTPLMDRKKQPGSQRHQPGDSTLPFTARPIVTNSRITKTQKLHRDMYLVFVTNALERKSHVCILSTALTGALTSDHRETLKISKSWSVSSISRVCLTTRPRRGHNFSCGFLHSLMLSPAWRGHILPSQRLSSRCPGQ